MMCSSGSHELYFFVALPLDEVLRREKAPTTARRRFSTSYRLLLLAALDYSSPSS